MSCGVDCRRWADRSFAAGVRVRLIEAADGPQVGSRGKGVRSLEVFEDLGLSIACSLMGDGGHSVVRKQAVIAFVGAAKRCA